MPPTSERFRLGAFVLLVFVLAATCVDGQKSSPVFWELRPDQITRMLLPIPDDNQVRFARLRRYFSDLHCTPELMQEQLVHKRGDKNLICVLPGKSPEQIIVAARYDQRLGAGGANLGWNEAVMLPILYNALLAQPRKRTFVFVALFGGDGQADFFYHYRKQHLPLPLAVVGLDSLGFGATWFYAPMVSWASSKKRERRQTTKQLLSEAGHTARLAGIPGLPQISPTNSQLSMLFDAKQIPAILVSSVYGGAALDQAFRENFDFLAYFLCRVDENVGMAPSATR